jgi:signal transduction histidine kinase
VIEVHNQGSPIPRSQLANIFEPMIRNVAGSEDKVSTSLGLGLHIAREIVLAHGGTVSVSSTERAGTTFSVRLPRPTPS